MLLQVYKNIYRYPYLDSDDEPTPSGSAAQVPTKRKREGDEDLHGQTQKQKCKFFIFETGVPVLYFEITNFKTSFARFSEASTSSASKEYLSCCTT